jgi:hypothetical protein
MTIGKRIVALVLCVTFCTVALWAGIGTREAMYVGGTITHLKERTEGKPLLQDASFVFEHHKTQQLEIPYSKINSLEYGQKAGRRLGLAIVVNPLFLFSKKRKHFLTIGYMDDNNKQQAAVFELGKSVIRPTLSGLEAKTGKKVEYEDAEARKAAEKK